jgi:spermidine synthase
VTRKSCHLEIFLISFAALLLEISYTRVFSFKLSSYFTYLIIGFAMLGIGAGGVFVALFRQLREAAAERLLPRLSLAGGLAIGLGYFSIAALEVSTHEPPSSAAALIRLAAICLALFASFLVIGLAIARIFTLRVEAFNRLYFADLAGAALGCAAAVPAMIVLSPPGCVFLGGAAVAASGLRLAQGGIRRASLVGLAALLALGAVGHEALPDPVVDPVKTMGRDMIADWGHTSVFRRWHPVFRIDVLDSAVTGPKRKWLIHDGQHGSNLWRFSGDLGAVRDEFADSDRALPFSVAKPEPRVLVIGAAGGVELLVSLAFGAQSVTGVELNPVTVSLLREHFADYTGHLPSHPKLELVEAEGRSFLRRDTSQYDLIYFVAPDSFASMNAAQASGFVLVEGYLYTQEAVEEALRHLAPGGVLCMQFGEVEYERAPNRTSRYLGTARKAYEARELGAFPPRVLLATSLSYPVHSSTILLRKEPFTLEQIDAVSQLASRNPKMQVRHPAEDPEDRRSIPNAVITAPQQLLERLYERYSFDITPVVDDAPFFWHFARWRDFFIGPANVPLRSPIDPTHGRGEAALMVMLSISAVFAAVFLLLPFLVIRDSFAALPMKGRTLLYFAAVGLGFMCFEISLIQKLTLFLGYPTYTLTVTLFGLLVFSGIGSLVTERYANRRNGALAVLVIALLVMGLGVRTGLNPLLDAIFGLPLAVRVAVTLLLLAPLGLCLGAFMPLGLATLVRITAPSHREAYAAWAWAVNGFFSVIGSMLVTMLAMTHGFSSVVLLATGIYLLAGIVLWRIPTHVSVRDPR